MEGHVLAVNDEVESGDGERRLEERVEGNGIEETQPRASIAAAKATAVTGKAKRTRTAPSTVMETLASHRAPFGVRSRRLGASASRAAIRAKTPAYDPRRMRISFSMARFYPHVLNRVR